MAQRRKKGNGTLRKRTDGHGKRISRNVYAQTREECEAKLAELIKERKAEIASEKEKLFHAK